MATFSQWHAGLGKNPTRRATWVCGDQPVLVAEVVDTIATRLDVTAVNLTTLRAGTDSDPAIWAGLDRFALSAGTNRLVLVRDAEKITDWSPLAGWLDDARTQPNVFALFVSNEADLTTVGAKKTRAPHLDLLMGHRHAQVIKAGNPNPTDAIAWARRRGRLRDDTAAAYLLTRVGGDLNTAAPVLTKLALFDGQVSKTIINALCAEVPAQSFVESLLQLRKPDALRAAWAMTDKDIARALGLLDTRLDLLAAICRQQRSGFTARDLPHFLVRQYAGVARHYDPRRCATARQVLAVVDDAFHCGARTGLLQTLTALW